MHTFQLPRRARQVMSAGVLLALGVVGACTEITSLKQQNPSALSVETLYVPANGALLANGAVADFECAFSRYVVGSGLFTDELTVAISQSANFDYDARRLNTNHPYGTNHCGAPTPSSHQQPGIYSPLSVARATGDTALKYLDGWTDAEVPNRSKLIAQAANAAGFSLVLLAEGMCSAAINVGPELTPAQLFAEAVTRFTKAIDAATAANDPAALNLARLGRARAALGIGGAPNLTAAAADAALIPTTFVATTSPDAINVRRQNLVFVNISQSAFSTVDPSFRGVTVPEGTAPDPRVAVTDLGRNGTAVGARLFLPAKHATNATPMRIGSYAEAQLIIAETRVAAGDLQGAADAINRARARTAGLPPYVLPAGATAADVKAHLLEERRRELFLEGHRLGDLRRFGASFAPAAGTPYPYGGAYGDQTCLPLPDVERINNPNVGGGA